MSIKTGKFFNVTRSVFHLESRDGHLKWKVTDLARSSGVSRQTIYTSFGNSKLEILKTALTYFVDELYGVSGEKVELASTRGLYTAVLMSREMCQLVPEAMMFYNKWRADERSEFYTLFIKYENLFKKTILNLNPELTDSEVLAAYVIIHGLCTLPAIAEEDIEVLYTGLLRPYKLNYF